MSYRNKILSLPKHFRHRSLVSQRGRATSTVASGKCPISSAHFIRRDECVSFFSTASEDNRPGDSSATASDDTGKETVTTPDTTLDDSDVNKEEMEFQAETRQLLDIVTHSLYTDKEVFLRELVSNASDSLEKLRHLQTVNATGTVDSDVPLEIRIELDEVTSSITIADTGIGMTKEEMKKNLGTIARSGSKNFIQELKNMEQQAETGAEQGIIGKFGVGFYSSFMVGDKVAVRSKSALAENANEPSKVWTSTGTGKYEIADLSPEVRQNRGSSVVIYLKEEHWDFCDEARIERILKRYSNFVNFPIYLNGNRVNTLDAIWAKDPKEVTDEEYTEFYKYIATAIDEPLDNYHFRVDAPLEVKALLFIPSFHSEKYGMSRMEPGVSLYSRKVLIEHASKDILPDWMRFVKGIVDSEDLPLSISRERAQDSALITKLRSVLTRKFIAHLTKMVKKDRSKYLDEFYKEYAYFLKEGICQDFELQAPLSKLLFFETSKNPASEMVSLDEYVGKMRPEQKDIYYLVAPTRDAAMNSPYLETFEKANVDVLIMYTAIEDFVMANLGEYEGRKLVSAEKGDIDLSELMPKDKEKDSDNDNRSEEDELYKAKRELSSAESLTFCQWFKKEVGEHKVASCTVTKRLSTSPAIVTDNESGAMRRMMRLVDSSEGNRESIPLPKQHVEVNTSHALIVGIHDLMEREPALARTLASQVYDNCLTAAGLIDDGRTMLPRLNDIMLCVVKGANMSTNNNSQTKQQEKQTLENATSITRDNNDAKQGGGELLGADGKPLT